MKCPICQKGVILTPEDDRFNESEKRLGGKSIKCSGCGFPLWLPFEGKPASTSVILLGEWPEDMVE